MNKKTIIALIISVAVCCAAIIVFFYAPFSISEDETADTLIKQSIGRSIAAIALAVIACLLGYKKIFYRRQTNFFKMLLFCLPCFAVAVANFPFSAIISGAAVVERYELLAVFILYCLLVACMEEILFRGILLETLAEFFKNNLVVASVAASAVFSLCHLFNLFGGAAAGSVLLQIGYTFLTGIMFSFAYICTGNIWTPVIIHALFNFGGELIPTLGTGAFQDSVFWILTAVFGLLCAVHILVCVLKNKPVNFIKNG